MAVLHLQGGLFFVIFVRYDNNLMHSICSKDILKVSMP